MRILHLTLKKKWFDMIASGEKKEEYREWKPYWAKRLTEGMAAACAIYAGSKRGWNKYDVVRFKNGYSKDALVFDIEFKGMKFGYGKRKWGALPKWKYIVIKLGNLIPSS